MKRARRIVAFALTLLLSTAVDRAAAAEPPSSAAPRKFVYGDYVMPRENCDIRKNGEPVSIKGRQLAFTVQAVDGDLVDLGFGKVKAAELVHFDEAIAYYTDWIAREPRSVDALFLRAMTYRGTPDYPKAVVDLSAAIELAPNIARLWYFRANMYEAHRDKDGRMTHADLALKDAAQALRLDPEEVNAVCIQRVIAVERSDVLNANSLLLRLNRFKPRDEISHFRVAKAFGVNNHYTSAIHHFTQALELNPYYSNALSERAYHWLLVNDFDNALADYERVIEIDPRDMAHRINRSDALYFMGREKECKEALAKAYELDPKEPSLKFAERLCMFKDPALRDGAKALELAKQAYETDKTYRTTFFLAVCYAEAGDFTTAAEYMLKAREIGPLLRSDPELSDVDRALFRFSKGKCFYHD